MKTINLLPKFRQQELRYEALLSGMRLVFVLSLLSFAVVFLAQSGTKFYLKAQAKSLSGQISRLQTSFNKQQDTGLKTQIQNVNNEVSDFNSLAAATPKWSNVLTAFAPLPPAGVKISSFSADSSDKSITINGFSPTRELVIELYNNILQDNEDFYNIDYPLDNVVNETNVNFHFTFYIQDKLLQ